MKHILCFNSWFVCSLTLIRSFFRSCSSFSIGVHRRSEKSNQRASRSAKLLHSNATADTPNASQLNCSWHLRATLFLMFIHTYAHNGLMPACVCVHIRYNIVHFGPTLILLQTSYSHAINFKCFKKLCEDVYVCEFEFFSRAAFFLFSYLLLFNFECVHIFKCMCFFSGTVHGSMLRTNEKKQQSNK